MKHLGHFIFIVAITFNGGCGRSGEPSARTSDWVTNGPPGVFMDQTEGHTALPVEKIRGWNNWLIFQMESITSKSSRAEIDESFRFQDPARRKAKFARVSAFQVKETDSRISLVDSTSGTALEFEKRGSLAILKTARGQPARLIHLSEDRANLVVSVLWEHPSSGDLVALYFSPREISRAAVDTQAKNGGPHWFISARKAKWSGGKARLSLCGLDKMVSRAAKRAVKKWQDALGSSLTIEVAEYASGYPPFSDLETQCIYLVNDYLVTPAPRKPVIGMTFIIEQPTLAGWVDGDIFLMKKEFEKIGGLYDQGSHGASPALDFVLVHEIGHWLGLDHLPAETARRTPSVMNDDGTLELTEYDRRAIRSLYVTPDASKPQSATAAN